MFWPFDHGAQRRRHASHQKPALPHQAHPHTGLPVYVLAFRSRRPEAPAREPPKNLQHHLRTADNQRVATTAQKQASAARRAKNQARGEARSYPRVRARPIYAGRTYKVTRRCLERRMFMSPGIHPDELANFLGYCLAHAANEHGVLIHACVMMSNHHHTDLTDPHGKLPAFKQQFHSMIARGLNTRLGRSDKFWSSDVACDVRRPNDDETLQYLVYTITNPVKDGLVKWSHQWPGFTTQGWRFGETRTFKRPAWFFDENGNMAEEVSLTLTRPPGFPELDDDALYDKLMTEVRAGEVEHQERIRGEGRRFMGVRKLARQHWNRAPQTFEERFNVARKVGASCQWKRRVEQQRDRNWEREYAAARALLRAGRPGVFPAGTYWMKRFAGVDVAEQPPP
jgi:putative transposase